MDPAARSDALDVCGGRDAGGRQRAEEGQEGVWGWGLEGWSSDFAVMAAFPSSTPGSKIKTEHVFANLQSQYLSASFFPSLVFSLHLFLNTVRGEKDGKSSCLLLILD